MNKIFARYKDLTKRQKIGVGIGLLLLFSFLFAGDGNNEKGFDIAATENAETLKTVSDLYMAYQRIDEYCGKTIDLGDVQLEINSIIGLMASTKELSEDAVMQLEDYAWEQGLSQNEKDDEHQLMSMMFAGMNTADRKRACRTAYDEITSTYRTMRVAMERAVKKDENK